MLTGEMPDKDLKPPSQKVRIDVRLDEVVLRALEQKPDLRYQQASILKTEVETIVADSLMRKKAPAQAVEFFDNKSRVAYVANFFASCIFFLTALKLAHLTLSGWTQTDILLFICFISLSIISGIQSVVQFSKRPLPAGLANHFSRPSIWGTIWAGWFAIGLPFLFQSDMPGVPPWLRMITLVWLGTTLTAPAGVTILGWFSMVQIRRSAGKIRGTALALFNGLLFPLLALDALIAIGIKFIGAATVHGFDWPLNAELNGLFTVMAFCIAAVDTLIVRAAWRAVKKPYVSYACSPTPNPTQSELDAMYYDPANWRWHVLYFYRKDPRIVVPKRIAGLGWTINFANSLSVPFIIGVCLGVWGLIALAERAGLSGKPMFAFQMALLAGVVWMCHVMSRTKVRSNWSGAKLGRHIHHIITIPLIITAVGILAGAGLIKYQEDHLPPRVPHHAGTISLGNMEFAPEHEVVIEKQLPSTTNWYYDLDHERFVMPPEALRNELLEMGGPPTNHHHKTVRSKALAEWIKQNGIDIAHYGDWNLKVFGGRWVDPPEKEWDAITPVNVIQHIANSGTIETSAMNSGIGDIYLLSHQSGSGQSIFQTRNGTCGKLQIPAPAKDTGAIKIRYRLLKDEPKSSNYAAQPLNDRIAVEDLALNMIVAIREKDTESLQSMAVDRIDGWRNALPVFAEELRERFRNLTGEKEFHLQPGEVSIDGDLAAVRCTGPAILKGKCLILLFARTSQGWKNCQLKTATEEASIQDLINSLRQQARDDSSR
ncbi:MAG: hypothetical protein JW713_05950, partial [Pontiellaceae bacterium]|nr:hypothetical protein [Pontiellaceae bacterium]